MILEKNNLQTVQGWTKSYIELIALQVHPPKKAIIYSITCQNHNGSWSQYIRPGKQILGKQIRPNFLRSTSLLYKILLTNMRACIHHIWGKTVLYKWGAVFIKQTSDRIQYLTILKYKLHSFNIQDHRSTRGLSAKPLKKIPKSPIPPAGFELWRQVWMKINRVTLLHNKKFILFIFYLVVL